MKQNKNFILLSSTKVFCKLFYAFFILETYFCRSISEKLKGVLSLSISFLFPFIDLSNNAKCTSSFSLVIKYSHKMNKNVLMFCKFDNRLILPILFNILFTYITYVIFLFCAETKSEIYA